jgi:hypothetical protein
VNALISDFVNAVVIDFVNSKMNPGIQFSY